MKQNQYQNTVLHFTPNLEIIKLLLNVFGKENKQNLIEFLMIENEHKETALHRASSKEDVEVIKLLFNTFKKICIS